MSLYLGEIATQSLLNNRVRQRTDMPHIFQHGGLWYITPWNGNYRALGYWEKALGWAEARNAKNKPC